MGDSSVVSCIEKDTRDRSGKQMQVRIESASLSHHSYRERASRLRTRHAAGTSFRCHFAELNLDLSNRTNIRLSHEGD